MMPVYFDHIRSSDGLVTTHEATRAGFVDLALEKSKRAWPLLNDARNLLAAASKANSPAELMGIKHIHGKLLTAAGLSDKALNYFSRKDKEQALQMLVENILEPAGEKFAEELVFRFLLVRGDTLGGSMRNIIGKLGQKKFDLALLNALKETGVDSCHRLYPGNKQKWEQINICDADVDLHPFRGLSWRTCGKSRVLVYNLTVPLVKKNVDMCLFNLSHDNFGKEQSRDPALYIAAGELKGGIDPAGADEHWKTARTSLERIRTAFIEKNHPIHTFFVGAAIEKEMAREIWGLLQNRTLSHAANLTDEKQIASVSRWLCGL